MLSDDGGGDGGPLSPTVPAPLPRFSLPDGALSLSAVLAAFGSPLHEGQLWAMCLATAQSLQTAAGGASSLSSSSSSSSTAATFSAPFVSQSGKWPVVTPARVMLVPEDSGVPAHVVVDESTACNATSDRRFMAPDPAGSPLATVFSLGATLFYAADFKLEADEEPSLSKELEVLLATMTDEDTADRCTLEEVCEAAARAPLAEVHRTAAVIQELIVMTRAIQNTRHAMSKPSSTAFRPSIDLHATLMQEIRAHVTPSRSASDREPVGGEEPERADDADDIRRRHGTSSKSSSHDRPENCTPATPLAAESMLLSKSAHAGQQTQPASPAPRTVHGSKRKLVLANELCQLHNWSPSQQVAIGFAAEAAQKQQEILQQSLQEKAKCDDQLQQGQEKKGQEEEEQQQQQQQQQPRPESDTVSPWDEVKKQEAPPFVRFPDLVHIQTTLVKAALENLHDDNPEMHKRVVAGKACFVCNGRISLFHRTRKCQICGCVTCPACTETRVLPAYMFAAGDARINKPLPLCTACRAGMGGWAPTIVQQ